MIYSVKGVINMKKIKTITFFTVIFVLCIFQSTYGFNVKDLSGTAVSNADALDLGNKIITVLTTIGSVLSVVVLIVIGIKYMLGSVGEKAEYKKTLVPYVIGAILVFTASVVAGAIYQLVP